MSQPQQLSELNELQDFLLLNENSPNFAKVIEKLSFDVFFEETAVSCTVSSLFQYLPHQHIVTPVKAVGTVFEEKLPSCSEVIWGLQ